MTVMPLAVRWPCPVTHGIWPLAFPAMMDLVARLIQVRCACTALPAMVLPARHWRAPLVMAILAREILMSLIWLKVMHLERQYLSMVTVIG